MSNNSSRRLAAILFADIAGYTALMQKDEQIASTLLRRFQNNIEELIPAHNGQVINFYGDGALCIFNNPLEAVRCAMSLQRSFQDDKKIVVPTRIGLHSGTVVFENGKIYGNSVNIASRIESMGMPGAVLLSKKIRDEIKNQPDIKIQSLGKFAFKNVEEEMEVFALANEGFLVPKKEGLSGKFKPSTRNNNILNWKTTTLTFMTILFAGYLIFQNKKNGGNNIPEPTEKSIAILPFMDISPDQDQEHLCYGIMEEINYRLNQIKAIDRIAPRTAVLPYKNIDQPLSEIAKALDVNYLVEGNFRKENQDVFVTINLIDTRSQKSIFQKRYPERWKNIFSLQANIASDISSHLDIVLDHDEKQKIAIEPTESKEAYTLFLRGDLAARRNEHKKAIEYFEKAIAIDTNYVEALFRLATTLHSQTTIFGDKTAKEVYPICLYYLNKAIEKSGGRADIVGFRASLKMFSDLDFSEIQKQFDLIDNHNYFHTHLMYAFCVGKYEFLTVQCKKELEKDPLYSWFYMLLAYSHFKLNEKEEAFQTIKKAVKLFPEDVEIREVLGKFYLYEKNYLEAIVHLEEAYHMAEYLPENEVLKQRIKSHLGIAKWHNGEQTEAQKLIEEIVLLNSNFLKPLDYIIAQYYAGVGEKIKTKEWLERAYQVRDVESIWIYTDPLMERFGTDNFYLRLLEKMGISETLTKQ